ncbi:MBL fold metallo-hydrolase [Saccharomonospora sp. NPDC046836]|uniref:MBL fold metallo-hydrolase n=1 Tax=Saccharomonospora sp. NPDC046836 TaxID=3156921 RepID=UPI0033DBED4E
MTADLPVCATCAMQYSAARPDCPICEDERQYVPPSGQRWTSLAELRAGDYSIRIEEQGPGVLGIGSEPAIGIGQRALLVPAESGNILWDCVPYLDADLVRRVTELGGLTAIAISHPHYYTTMVEWAEAFDVPIYLHEKDQQWIGRPHERIRLWSGQTHELADGVTLVNLGVHFDGGTVLHWRDGADGKGALFSGDIVQVVPNRALVAFMYSYPNYIPERPAVVRHAGEVLERLAFDDIYGAWWGAVIRGGGGAIVRRSVARYLGQVA